MSGNQDGSGDGGTGTATLEGQGQQGGEGQGGETLIAGKFKDEGAFNTAFAELTKHEKVNMPALAGIEFADTATKVEQYKRMESMLGTAAPVNDPTKLPKNLAIDQTKQPPKPIDMAALVSGVGLEQEAIGQTFATGGKLDDEMYDKLGKATITLPDGTSAPLSREIIDSVLSAQSSQQQLSQVYVQQAAQLVGGADKLDALLKFGSTLPAATQQAINIELGHPQTIESGVNRLNALYAQQIGADKSNGMVNNGQAPGSQETAAFKSEAERQTYFKKHGNTEAYQKKLLNTPDDVIGSM